MTCVSIYIFREYIIAMENSKVLILVNHVCVWKIESGPSVEYYICVDISLMKTNTNTYTHYCNI